MPKNRWLYIGLLTIAGAALIYVGAWLTQRIDFIVPYAFGVGVVLIIVGLVQEAKKKKDGDAAPEGAPPTPPG